MKKLGSLLSLITMAVSLSVGAVELPKLERKAWTDKISKSCQKSFLIYHGKQKTVLAKSACDCAAENMMIVSEREEKIETAKTQLHWINLYYSKLLSEEEIDQDPFYLDHNIATIGEGCLASGSFRVSL